MKKRLLIALGVVLMLLLTPFVIIKLAFGPLHDSVTIDLGAEGELICDETYNADLADVFYDVKMVLETPNGKTFKVGSATFHDENWHEQIKITRAGDWLVVPFQPGNFVQVKMLNTANGQLNDTTMRPYDLGTGATDLYSGSSKILEVSGNTIEVNYAYHAKAKYPTQIFVNQKVVYEINTAEGELRAKEMGERVVQ